MKKIFCVVLAMTLALLLLTTCGSGKEAPEIDSAASDMPAATETADVAAEIDWKHDFATLIVTQLEEYNQSDTVLVVFGEGVDASEERMSAFDYAVFNMGLNEPTPVLLMGLEALFPPDNCTRNLQFYYYENGVLKQGEVSNTLRVLRGTFFEREKTDELAYENHEGLLKDFQILRHKETGETFLAYMRYRYSSESTWDWFMDKFFIENGKLNHQPIIDGVIPNTDIYNDFWERDAQNEMLEYVAERAEEMLADYEILSENTALALRLSGEINWDDIEAVVIRKPEATYDEIYADLSKFVPATETN